MLNDDDRLADSQIKLYIALVDQLQKYNAILWQAPLVLLVGNLVAFETLLSTPWVLIAVSVFDLIFIYGLAKIALRQRDLINSTQRAEHELRERLEAFIPVFSEPPGYLRRSAPKLLIGVLSGLAIVLLIYGVYAVTATQSEVNPATHNVLNVVGLAINFCGALLLIYHSFRMTRTTDSADQDLELQPWFFRSGLMCLALGFLMQLIASLQ